MIDDDDMPHGSDDDRYAVYTVTGWAEGALRERPHHRVRIAETSQDGIGCCLVTLRDEGQLTNDSRVGILDRRTRQWVINPWAKGDSA